MTRGSKKTCSRSTIHHSRKRRRRRLGQHFLTNPQLAEKIVRLAGVTAEDTVLEIGPGKGILTEALLKKCRRLIAVEKDPALADSLQTKYADDDRIQIYSKDFLSFDLQLVFGDPRSTIHESPAKVVANLPYSIATEIIFRLIDHRQYFSELYVMVQKEVADRLVAKPGKKDYGVLSILTQLYSESRVVLKVSPGAFSPPPKVDSAVVAMQLSEQPRVEVQDVALFKKLVKQAFSTRRKMLRNALKMKEDHRWQEICRKIGIDLKARAETVSLEQFAVLAGVMAPEMVHEGSRNDEWV